MVDDKIYALRTIKYHETRIINICDFDILGKQIEQNNFSINLSKDYFYEEKINEEEAKEILKTASITNLVGNSIVNLALKLNLAKANSVKRIENIPFLMIFNFKGTY